MATRGATVTRILGELQRSNLTTQTQDALNDAILEASSNRFYFNEMTGLTFGTVIGQEYYSDLNVTEIDSIWYVSGGSRMYVEPINNIRMDELMVNTSSGGPPIYVSRYAQQLRIYPIPSAATTLLLTGYGRLTPWPMANDADTSAWLTEGEQYVRALTKRNVLRDVIHDVGEAMIYEAVAEDYKDVLFDRTTSREASGTVTATKF